MRDGLGEPGILGPDPFPQGFLSVSPEPLRDEGLQFAFSLCPWRDAVLPASGKPR
jgi:hypothetical protein